MAITTFTPDKFRATTSVPTAEAYELVAPGRTGRFYYDKEDKTSADDDGTVFVNKKGHRLKRDTTDVLQATWFGYKRGDDPSILLNKLLKSGRFKDLAYNGTIVFPASYVSWSQTVHLEKTGLSIRCEDGMLLCRNDTGGNMLTNKNGQVVHLYGISFIGLGYQWMNKLDKVGDELTTYLSENALLRFSGRFVLENCSVSNSLGNGVDAQGYIGVDGSNVAGSSIRNTVLALNSGAGAYFNGPDAAPILVDAMCDIRNNGIGVWDRSTFGAVILCNLFHTNYFGNIKLVGGPGTMGISAFNYQEGGSESDEYTGQSTVIGNRHSGNPQVGHHVQYDDPRRPFKWVQTTPTTWGLYTADANPSPLLEFGTYSAPLLRPATLDRRDNIVRWVNLLEGYANGKALNMVVDSLDAARKMDYFFVAGDTVISRSNEEQGSWTVVAGGNGGGTPGDVVAYLDGNSGGNIVLKGDVSKIVAGSVLLLEGKRGEEDFSYTILVRRMYFDEGNQAWFAQGNYSIAPFPPVPVKFPRPVFERTT